MPDNEDYGYLERLLARPESWTDQERLSAEGLLAQQRDALATAPPKDERLKKSMTEVIRQLENAIEQSEGQAQ